MSGEKNRNLEKLSDGELVKESLGNNTWAFEELVERYYEFVYGFIYKKMRDKTAVEDLVQETFLEAYKSLKSCRQPAKYSTWLFSIAHNRIGKWLRKKQPVHMPESFEAACESEINKLFTREDISALESILESFPEDTRKILKLKYDEGLSCSEIGRRLGKPAGTIMSLLSRAYQALRTKLKPPMEDV